MNSTDIDKNNMRIRSVISDAKYDTYGFKSQKQNSVIGFGHTRSRSVISMTDGKKSTINTDSNNSL